MPTRTSILNVFETPWLLLAVAVFLFLVIQIIYVFSDKWRFWLITLPILTASIAIGLDYFVKTDLEKINYVFRSIVKAAEKEDIDRIAEFIAEDYTDRRNSNKKELVDYFKYRLKDSNDVIDRNTILNSKIFKSQDKAKVEFKVLIMFDQQGKIADSYGVTVITLRMRMFLEKQKNQEWLLTGSEILQLNNRDARWYDI